MLYSERESETSPLKIEEIRSVMQRLALKPFEARYRIAIFRDFDTAQPRAQDALLKTLEEPAPHAILILLARSLEADPADDQQPQPGDPPAPGAGGAGLRGAARSASASTKDQAALLARVSGGRIGWALRALDDPDLLAQREQALNLLEEVLGMNRARRFDLANDLVEGQSRAGSPCSNCGKPTGVMRCCSPPTAASSRPTSTGRTRWKRSPTRYSVGDDAGGAQRDAQHSCRCSPATPTRGWRWKSCSSITRRRSAPTPACSASTAPSGGETMPSVISGLTFGP